MCWPAAKSTTTYFDRVLHKQGPIACELSPAQVSKQGPPLRYNGAHCLVTRRTKRTHATEPRFGKVFGVLNTVIHNFIYVYLPLLVPTCRGKSVPLLAELCVTAAVCCPGGGTVPLWEVHSMSLTFAGHNAIFSAAPIKSYNTSISTTNTTFPNMIKRSLGKLKMFQQIYKYGRTKYW